MDAKEREALAAALQQKSPEELEEIGRKARETLTQLEDLNSAYPATKEFLAARGLTNVRELDKEGMRELKEHLERTLQSLCKAKA
ncbi:MAG TPA: hypothetical protein VLC10_04560 [Patescibacteria group bacterium]|nr:hypothetical protein [Patescibacteria group bacterium]